mgnify:CR=1 FL=1
MHRRKLVERRAASYNVVRAACKRHEVVLAKGEAAWSKESLTMLGQLVEPVVSKGGIPPMDDEQTWLLEVVHQVAQIQPLNTQIDQVEHLIKQEVGSPWGDLAEPAPSDRQRCVLTRLPKRLRYLPAARISGQRPGVAAGSDCRKE